MSPPSKMSERLETWRLAGREERFRERAIHVHTQKGEGPVLLLLHGFPSSSYDWRGVIARCPERPVLAFDFLGFGFSDKPKEHNYTLSWQADLAEEMVARHAGGREVFVCAHDMGTSVATELLARDLAGELGFEVSGAMLFNGSILLDRASLTLGQKLLRSRVGPVASRLASESFFRRQFGSVFSEAHPASDKELVDQWALISHNDGNRVGHKLVNYMDERIIYAERWHGAIRDWPGRLHLVWGLEDPVATVDVLDGLVELRPDVPVTRFPGLGHYPQIEDPERLTQALEAALAAPSTSL